MARGSHIALDGYSSVDQGLAGVVKSRGSQTVRCDLDELQSWWDLLPPILELPPRPEDENGVPYVLCGGCGQYVRRAGFSEDASRPNGLKGWCKTCCATRDHVRALREAAAQGRALRAKPGRPPKWSSRNA